MWSNHVWAKFEDGKYVYMDFKDVQRLLAGLQDQHTGNSFTVADEPSPN